MRKDALTSQTILGQLHTKSLDFKIIELHIQMFLEILMLACLQHIYLRRRK